MIRSFAPLFVCCLLPICMFAQLFTEESKQRGIDHAFRHKALTGGGAAFFDYDNDGDDDLYLTGGLDRDRLYENLGDGTFNRLPNDIGLNSTIRYNTMGVSIGDINNDGFRDLFVCTWDFQNNLFGPNLLFLNNGDGTFSDISESAGILEADYAISATFLDFDKDGFLDIYVVSNVEMPVFTFDENDVITGYDHLCYPNLFYKNNGDLTFTEMAAELGVDSRGCGLAIIASDMDGDEDLDLYIANDFGAFVVPNEQFSNQYPTLGFTNTSMETGTNVGIYGMGIAAGDYDQDLDTDYYVTNIASNVFFENENGQFTDVATQSGVANEKVASEGLNATSWGTEFLDVNNDTWLDLYVANGRIPALPQDATAMNDPNKLFLNNGDRTFSDISESAGVADERIARGMISSDIDQDGDLDILTVILENFEPDAHSKLYINQSDNTNNYIQFSLIGVASNRDAYGSKLWLYAGDQTFFKETYGGGASYGSQSSSVVHFGLGNIEFVDSLKIDWPNGHQQMIYAPAINTRNTVTEDVLISANEASLQNPYVITVFPNPFSTELTLLLDRPLAQVTDIHLIAIDGRIVFNENFPALTEQIQLRASQIPTGLYTLQLVTSNHVLNQKIIKIK